MLYRKVESYIEKYLQSGSNKVLFKKYLIVGGLPDAVNTFVEQHNVVAIRKIQEDIHALYGLDASKYEKEHARLKIQRIYNLIPSNLENRKKRTMRYDWKKY